MDNIRGDRNSNNPENRKRNRDDDRKKIMEKVLHYHIVRDEISYEDFYNTQLLQSELRESELGDKLQKILVSKFAEHVYLKYNKILSLEGIETLCQLEEFLISHNQIQSLKEISSLTHPNLRILDLEDNQIQDANEITVLENLLLLTSLSLVKNPVTIVPHIIVSKNEVSIPPVNSKNATANLWTSRTIANIYLDGESDYDRIQKASYISYRLHVAFRLRRLQILDGIPVTAEEKVYAINLYDPPLNVVASIQHSLLVKSQLKLYSKIKSIELQCIKKLRPLVLCGPSGVGKRTLKKKLIQEFPHIYSSSVSHTTRVPRRGEVDGINYHFVTLHEMERMIESGQFVEVVTLLGYLYGTSIEAIDKVAEEGKICVMDMEIE
ncbi:hypothetical protein HK096_007949, partial [Nowakowskiella sp. JEL0078]